MINGIRTKIFHRIFISTSEKITLQYQETFFLVWLGVGRYNRESGEAYLSKHAVTW